MKTLSETTTVGQQLADFTKNFSLYCLPTPKMRLNRTEMALAHLKEAQDIWDDEVAAMSVSDDLWWTKGDGNIGNAEKKIESTIKDFEAYARCLKSDIDLLNKRG